MARALLVAHENVLDLVLLEKLIVDRKDRTARIAEDMLYAVILQRLHHHLRAAHLAPAGVTFCVTHRSLPVFAYRAKGRLSVLRAIKKAP